MKSIVFFAVLGEKLQNDQCLHYFCLNVRIVNSRFLAYKQQFLSFMWKNALKMWTMQMRIRDHHILSDALNRFNFKLIYIQIVLKHMKKQIHIPQRKTCGKTKLDLHVSADSSDPQHVHYPVCPGQWTTQDERKEQATIKESYDY